MRKRNGMEFRVRAERKIAPVICIIFFPLMRLEIVSINMNQMKRNGMEWMVSDIQLRERKKKTVQKINKYTHAYTTFYFTSFRCSVTLSRSLSRGRISFCGCRWHFHSPYMLGCVCSVLWPHIYNAQCAYLNVSTHFLMGNHYDKAVQ